MLLPMPAAPRATVVVPVHRGAETLPAALGSILRQTYRDFEIVVAGDGADESVEEAALSTGDPRVRWEGFSKAPGLGYSNRDRAISRAHGDLIAYLSPDDLWAPDHLECLVGTLDRGPADFVFSRPVVVRADGRPRPHFLPFELARDGAAPAPWILACVSPSQALHTRKAYERAGGWRDGLPFHGDVDLWLRCRESGARIAFVRTATVIRFPSYSFKRVSPVSFAGLHARYAEELASGKLVPGDLRWPPGKRFLGWMEDVRVVALPRGAKWARALLRRRRAVQRPVDPNPPEPRADSGSRSAR
jgi:glycosyltransferase involved in cell wall biosynthesis